MYQMKLLTGGRTKSANVVGATMKLNPHGDGAIYETMVRLSRGYGALLHPPVDSKGNFGKVYSRDMAYAAAGTPRQAGSICAEVFKDIDSDTVDMVDNYDATTQEPTLLPVTFPTILANNTLASPWVWRPASAHSTWRSCARPPLPCLKTRIMTSAPPCPHRISWGGGYILYNEEDIGRIYETAGAACACAPDMSTRKTAI